MFSFKSKLDDELKKSIYNKEYKQVRIVILCKSLQGIVEKKIKSYKGLLLYSIPSLHCICAIMTTNSIEKLLELPAIESIHFDGYALLCGHSVNVANGIAFQERYKLTGKGIGIGIIDSGVYPHPDLLTPTNKIKHFSDLVHKHSYPYDDYGHGTFTAGLICSSGASSKGLYRGVAEKSHIYAIKAFNSLGRAFLSDILFAIDLLLNESEEYNIKVICLPFEILEHTDFFMFLFSKLFNKAVEKNIVIVVPSGHNGHTEGSICGIATLNNCITVGGLDTRSTIKPYEHTSSGPFGKFEKPDLAAACVDLCSLNTNKNYISERNGSKLYAPPLESPYTCYTGTSVAAAYISGLCALLFENNPDLTYKDILALLKVSCKILDCSKWLQGLGMVDTNKLLP